MDEYEDLENFKDEELLRWFTETEAEIVKTALAKTIKQEELTIVEDVMLREYKIRLKARNQAREARGLDRRAGGYDVE